MEQDIDYKGYRIKIRHDENCDSPNDWGNTDIFLVYSHRQFDVERKGFSPDDIFEYLRIKSILNHPVGVDEDVEELQDELSGYDDYESKYWIFPVDAYIHSGVHISLANTRGYPDRRWDVSTTGFALVDKEGWEEFDDAVKAAEGLMEEWNQYLSGDIYGFIVEKPNTIYSISKEKFDRLKFENDLATLESEFDIESEWTEVDSCWGFYGDPEKSGLIKEAEASIDYLIEHE